MVLGQTPVQLASRCFLCLHMHQSDALMPLITGVRHAGSRGIRSNGGYRLQRACINSAGGRPGAVLHSCGHAGPPRSGGNWLAPRPRNLRGPASPGEMKFLLQWMTIAALLKDVYMSLARDCRW